MSFAYTGGKKCGCGLTWGTIHRFDGPCYVLSKPCECPEPEKLGHNAMLPHELINDAPAVESDSIKAIEKGRIFNHRDGMAELERFDMEAKARELADWMWGVRHINPRTVTQVVDRIVTALAAERKAGRKELFSQTYWDVRLKEANVEGYRRGLEEAAKIAEEMEWRSNAEIAHKIRQRARR